MTNINFDANATRRSILAALGTGVAATVLGKPALAGFTGAQELTDADILIFALNLEYLEAEFYAVATTGNPISGLDTRGVGEGGRTLGGRKVPFRNKELEKLAIEIAADELAHVRFLRTALGKSAVVKPTINLAALKIGFASEIEFITLARAFEDVGVSAYRGAAKLIKNNDYLDAAAGILSAEAYHAGALRSHAVYAGIDGPKLDEKDQVTLPDNWVPTDKNGLVVGRTPAEVGAIVRGPKTAGGAFFPNGLNGKIQ